MTGGIMGSSLRLPDKDSREAMRKELEKLRQQRDLQRMKSEVSDVAYNKANEIYTSIESEFYLLDNKEKIDNFKNIKIQKDGVPMTIFSLLSSFVNDGKINSTETAIEEISKLMKEPDNEKITKIFNSMILEEGSFKELIEREKIEKEKAIKNQENKDIDDTSFIDFVTDMAMD